MTLEALTAGVEPARLRRDLAWFASVRRDTGGEGEDRACEYIASRLRETGVPVDVHEFDAFLSYPRAARLSVVGDESADFTCLTHSFACSTGAGGVTGELVPVTGDDLASAAGRIAFVTGLATPVTILRASEAGCLGIVFANEDVAVHNMIGTTIWGTPGADDLARLPRIAALSVGSDSGARLRARLASAPVRVRLETRVETGWYRSRLPEVRIEGRGDPRAFILVGGHYCAWEVGITDNATGDACLIEMARLLWESRDQLLRGVRLCWWPGHSHGRYSGSTWYADTFFRDLDEGAIAYFNIDSPGVRGATRYVARHTCAELEDFCRQVIAETTGQFEAPVHRPSRAADQSFLALGVPSFSAYPFLPDEHPDRRPWTGGSANAWWWHTSFDTLDKADVDILATDVRLGLRAVWHITTHGLLPLRTAAAIEEIVDVLTALAARVHPHLDLAPALAEAHALQRLLRLFDAAAARLDGEVALESTWNAAAMRLGRVLNPVVYSKGGRFTHDPAEWSPVMRATRRFTLPGLTRAEGLPARVGHEDFRFLRAQLVREVNRLRTALRDASSVADDCLHALPLRALSRGDA